MGPRPATSNASPMATASSSPGSKLLRENFTIGSPNMVVAQGKVDVAFGDFYSAGRRHGGPVCRVSSLGAVALGNCTVVAGKGKRLQLSRLADGGPRTEYWGNVESDWSNGSRRLPSDRNGLYEKNALGYAATPAIFGPPKNPPFLDPGAYTWINGAGGPDVSAFRHALDSRYAPRR